MWDRVGGGVGRRREGAEVAAGYVVLPGDAAGTPTKTVFNERDPMLEHLEVKGVCLCVFLLIG